MKTLRALWTVLNEFFERELSKADELHHCAHVSSGTCGLVACESEVLADRW